MKFGSYSNLKKLQSGKLYAKKLQYYVDLEKETGSTDKGDMFESKQIIYNAKICLKDLHTSKTFETRADHIEIDYGYTEYPVFCMFLLDERNYIRGSNSIYRYRFSSEQKDKMKNFGDSVLIIHDNDKFFNKVYNAAIRERIDFKRGLVKYYNIANDDNYLIDTTNDRLMAAYWKRNIYSYQQEYRFLFKKSVEDHLEIDIGNISDISCILNSNQVLKSEIELII